MVIDGIRVDFVTADFMPYTSAVMGNGQGEGCQLTARVAAPTVTLPRVKVRDQTVVPDYSCNVKAF